MRIQEIAIGYVNIPLVTPFKTALRTVDSVNDLIVKIIADDGTEGFGEAPPTAASASFPTKCPTIMLSTAL